MWLALGIILIVTGAFLLVLEVFIPSFGLLSCCAIASIVAGVWLFFKVSVATGWIGVGISVVLVPVTWIIAYRMLPKTRFGKSVILKGPQRDKGDAIADTDSLKELLGKTGVVVSPLRPVGMCEFSGTRYECVAETGFVEKDMTVKVIHVEETQLTVRIVEDNK